MFQAQLLILTEAGHYLGLAQSRYQGSDWHRAGLCAYVVHTELAESLFQSTVTETLEETSVVEFLDY